MSAEQFHQDYENAIEFICISIGDRSAGVTVRTDSEGRGFLWATDYVANDWLEVFPTLAMALGRFALLVACSSDDWQMMFADNSDAFVSQWSEFQAKNLI